MYKLTVATIKNPTKPITVISAIKDAVKTGDYEWYYIAYMFRFMLDNIDAMISVTYIMLTFPFTAKYYDSLCVCAHKRCVRFWTRSVEDAGYDEDR